VSLFWGSTEGTSIRRPCTISVAFGGLFGEKFQENIFCINAQKRRIGHRRSGVPTLPLDYDLRRTILLGCESDASTKPALVLKMLQFWTPENGYV